MAKQNDRATGAPTHLPARVDSAPAGGLVPLSLMREAIESASTIGEALKLLGDVKAVASSESLQASYAAMSGEDALAVRTQAIEARLWAERRLGELLPPAKHGDATRMNSPSSSLELGAIKKAVAHRCRAIAALSREEQATYIADAWAAGKEPTQAGLLRYAAAKREGMTGAAAPAPAAPAIRCGWRGPMDQRLRPDQHAVADMALSLFGAHTVREPMRADGTRLPPYPAPWPCPKCREYVLYPWRSICPEPECGHDNRQPWALDDLYHQPRNSRTHLEHAYVMAACAVYEARDPHARERGDVPASAVERLDAIAELLERARDAVAELVLEERAA